jgi:hypothetical protein
MAILRNLFLTARQILLPTIRLQEEPDEATFGVADRFERGAACGLTASSPPDTDLSCLPIVPPVLPAWRTPRTHWRMPNAIGLGNQFESTRAASCAPGCRGDTVPVKYGYWKTP